MTTAQRRQIWGEYKYYTPSRFLDEIPANLIEEEESALSEYTSDRSTFRSAVKSVSGGKTKNKTSFAPDGYVKPSKSFGSNFVAPGKGVREKKDNVITNSFGSSFVAPSLTKTTTVVKRTPAKAIVKKNPINKQKEEEKLKAFWENNPIKQKIEEQKRKEAELAERKKQKEELKNATIQYFFNVGERVFHEKLGIGHITDVIQIGDSTMYTIDFGKMGKKAMDAAYAHLKKF